MQSDLTWDLVRTVISCSSIVFRVSAGGRLKSIILQEVNHITWELNLQIPSALMRYFSRCFSKWVLFETFGEQISDLLVCLVLFILTKIISISPFWSSIVFGMLWWFQFFYKIWMSNWINRREMLENYCEHLFLGNLVPWDAYREWIVSSLSFGAFQTKI